MGIEIDTDYGGAGCNFMTTILAIEEISKVDPAVAVLVDIQNTLVNAVIKKLGTKEQKEKYLPRLATDMVIFIWLNYFQRVILKQEIKLAYLLSFYPL